MYPLAARTAVHFLAGRPGAAMCAPRSAALLLGLLLLAGGRLAGARSVPYTNFVELSENSSLWFRVNRAEKLVDLALQVDRPLPTGDVALGLGIAEPTSGALRGSDLFIAEFRGNDINCTWSDRHVPFTAFPLAFPPAVEFRNDTVPNDTWRWRACRRLANGTVLLEVSHRFEPASNNGEDRPIRAGVQQVVHMFGTSLSSFSSNRFSTPITFFNENENTPVVQERPLPPFDDIIVVPSGARKSPKKSNFTCFAIPRNKSTARMIVAVDAEVRNPDVVRRVVVYGCEDSEFFTNFDGDKVCNWRVTPLVIGLEPRARCSTVFYSWAPHVGRLVFPREAGILLGPENQILVLELHLETQLGTYAANDVKVKLYYTNTERQFKAGTLAIGDPGYYLEGNNVRSNSTSEFSCTGRCTEFFNGSINLFASHLHSGRHARSILIRKRDSEGFSTRTIHEIDFWTHQVQQYYYFPKPVVVQPGESLSTVCSFDVSKVPGHVLYGRRTIDEKCLAYVHYWPVQEREPGDGSLFYCGYAFDRAGRRATVCGAGYKRNKLIALQDNAVCFPSSARVILADGTQREMRELRLGDRVLVRDGVYSEVFMFTHRDDAVEAPFVHITLADGKALALTSGHYLYANGKLAPARDVRVGDVLEDAKGKAVRVVQVAQRRMRGLYNPQTLHGDIVVNGMRASTYTTAVAPGAAHAILAPLRGATGWFAAFWSAQLDGQSQLRDFGIWAFGFLSSEGK